MNYNENIHNLISGIEGMATAVDSLYRDVEDALLLNDGSGREISPDLEYLQEEFPDVSQAGRVADALRSAATMLEVTADELVKALYVRPFSEAAIKRFNEPPEGCVRACCCDRDEAE